MWVPIAEVSDPEDEKGYVDIGKATVLHAAEISGSGGPWRIQVDGNVFLTGSYASKADAIVGIRDLLVPGT